MVEVTTSGSELVELSICNNFIVALRYKLRMFGVRFQGLVYVLCDNLGVVKNMIIPELVLQYRYNVINYHSVREAFDKVPTAK